MRSLVLISSVTVALFTYSCASSGQHSAGRTVEREFELSFEYPNASSDFLTVICKIDSLNKYAEFVGLSSLNTQVFSLKVNANKFIFVDTRTNKQQKGTLSAFKLFPISEELVFKELPNLQEIKVLTLKNGTVVKIEPVNSFY